MIYFSSLSEIISNNLYHWMDIEWQQIAAQK